MSIAELIAKTVRRYELTVKAKSNDKALQEKEVEVIRTL